MHESAPPEVLDIAFELDAERPVVPGICQSAVDIRARENEPPALAERGDLVHGDDAGLLGGAHHFALSGSRSGAAPLSSYHERGEPAGGRCQGVAKLSSATP